MSDNLPARIGGHEIIGVLGEGAMGRVYLARQRSPDREVALKVVAGVGPAASARIQREIAALARLAHPGIARLYAAGEEPGAGLPMSWLSMEYVRGVDLRAWRQQVQGRPRAVAGLLVALCEAVQHAHGNGIVHRDLKPENILVDAEGRPRVLDFGIARLLGPDAGATQAGQVLGSLPYMAPEQLAGPPEGVDARADIHALGVIAFELLAGRLPWPQLASATLFEAVAVHRGGEPPRLARVLPGVDGDLDAIVGKAMAAAPERRYASAAELGADLTRWLDQRPVEARSPTAAYLLSRLLRRHRVAALAAGLVLATLVVATAVSLRLAWSEARARALAEQRLAGQEAVNEFLERMLSAADPSRALGRAVTVAQVLDEAELGLDDIALPSVRAAVRRTLAQTRAGLGEFERALALVDEALAQAPRDEPELAHGLLRLRGSLLAELGRFDDALATLQEARAAWPLAPPARRARIDLAVARVHDEAGRPREAEDGYRGLVAEAEAGRLADDDASVETARSNLLGLLRDSGRLEVAAALAESILALRLARDGERHPRTLSTRNARATLLQAQGRAEEAIAEARAVLALRDEVLGEGHADTLTSMQLLANMLLESGRLDEAEPLVRTSLAGFQARFGPGHAQALTSLNALAFLQEARGDVAAAEATYRELFAQGEAAGQGDSPPLLAPRNNLAMLLLEAGRPAEAEAVYVDLLERTGRALGREHAYHAIFTSNHGLALLRLGRRAEAEAALRDARVRLAGLFGEDHPRTQAADQRLAQAQAAAGAAP